MGVSSSRAEETLMKQEWAAPRSRPLGVLPFAFAGSELRPSCHRGGIGRPRGRHRGMALDRAVGVDVLEYVGAARAGGQGLAVDEAVGCAVPRAGDQDG